MGIRLHAHTKHIIEYGTEEFSNQQSNFTDLISTIESEAEDEFKIGNWIYGYEDNDEFEMSREQVQYILDKLKAMEEKEFKEFNLDKTECIEAFEGFLSETTEIGDIINFTWF